MVTRSELHIRCKFKSARAPCMCPSIVLHTKVKAHVHSKLG